MNAEQLIINAFKKEVDMLVKAYGIKHVVKIYGSTSPSYGHTGPFAYFPKDTDLLEFLEELYND